MSKAKCTLNDGCRCKKCKYLLVLNTFKTAGCELLTYTSLSEKMTYKCCCGNISNTRWFNFRNGERCKKCGMAKTKKHNSKRLRVAATIHEQFIANNCKLLEDKYTNQSTPMKYICECGNESTITWKLFKKGCRCQVCAKNKIASRFIPSGESHCFWNPNREEIKFNKIIRQKAKSALKRTLNGKMKSGKTFELLGYTKEGLTEHIKNHPNWHEVKNGEWEIDHYFPISAFTKYGIYDTKIINMLENLRPLNKIDNRIKNERYDKREFENWLNLKGIRTNEKKTS